MSNNRYIFDTQRQRVASVQVLANGDQVLFDVSGRRLGKYDRRMDRTYDDKFNTFAYGDQLLRLLDRP